MDSQPGQYEFLPHTADAKFRAYGKTLHEAFGNAAKAMFSIMTDIEKIKPKLKFPLKFKAESREAALFDFLDKLIFLLDTEGFLLHECKDLLVDRNCDGSYWVSCTAVGDKHKGYDVHSEVKAVTYNEMSIEFDDKRVVVQVVVDI
jgi:SHS2 domain-containing protein